MFQTGINWLSFFAIFLTVFQATASPQSQPPTLDSIQAMIEVNRILHQIHDDSEALTSDSILTLLHRAEEVITPYPTTTAYYKVYWQMGETYRAASKADYALSVINKGLLHIQESDYRASLLNLKAGVYFELNQYDTTLALLKQSEGLADYSTPKGKRLYYLNTWLKASVYRNLGQKIEAIAAFKEALSPKANPDTINRTTLIANIGFMLYDVGKRDEGLDSLASAFRFAKNTPSNIGGFDPLKYIQILLKEDKLQQARTVLNWYQLENEKVYRQQLKATTQYTDLTVELTKKEIENERLKTLAKRQAQKNAQACLIGIVCFLVILLLFRIILRFWNSKSKLQANNTDLAKTQSKLETERQALQQLNEEKNMLLSVVSHDMRGPVGGLRSTLELALEGYLTPEEQTMLLTGLHDKVAHTEDLLNDVLLWAKAQMNGFDLELSLVHLDPLIEGIVQQTRPQWKEKMMDVHILGEAPIVWGNEGLLKVAVRNVLANAIRYNKTGTPIEITFSQTEQYAGLSIRDKGTGMPADVLEKLTKETGKKGGVSRNGLGLLLVKDFVHIQHGYLEVDSSSMGTCITLWLPLPLEMAALWTPPGAPTQSLIR